MTDVGAVIAQTHREEWARMVATLARARLAAGHRQHRRDRYLTRRRDQLATP